MSDTLTSFVCWAALIQAKFLLTWQKKMAWVTKWQYRQIGWWRWSLWVSPAVNYKKLKDWQLLTSWTSRYFLHRNILLPSSSNIINSTLIGFSCLLQHKWEIPREWEFAYWNKSASNYLKSQAVRKELIQQCSISSNFSVLKNKTDMILLFQNQFPHC